MSASAGPAADNNELRAQLEAAIHDALRSIELPLTGTGRVRWADGKPMASAAVLAAIPLIVAFGDARYQEGRNDAGEDAMRILEKHVVRLARGEG